MMISLVWSEAQNHFESIAVCLRAVLRHFDVDRPYDELVAALGLGGATVAAADDGLGWWCTYARDTDLIGAAACYGLRLRPLHPTGAAVGLAESAEFAQHFHDSYVPLIRRALDHGQPVLAWRGWPAPRDRLWGVVTGVQGDTLLGYTLWHDGQPLPLLGPAHQVYVVEEFDAASRRRDAERLFCHVARQACQAWDDRWSPAENVTTGHAAFEAWKRALRAPENARRDPMPLWRQQSQAARVLVAARIYLATWLRRHRDYLDGDALQLAAHWANTCDHVSDTLLPYESADVVKELFATPRDVERICHALSVACEIESELIDALRARLKPRDD